MEVANNGRYAEKENSIRRGAPAHKSLSPPLSFRQSSQTNSLLQQDDVLLSEVSVPRVVSNRPKTASRAETRTRRSHPSSRVPAENPASTVRPRTEKIREASLLINNIDEEKNRQADLRMELRDVLMATTTKAHRITEIEDRIKMLKHRQKENEEREQKLAGDMATLQVTIKVAEEKYDGTRRVLKKATKNADHMNKDLRKVFTEIEEGKNAFESMLMEQRRKAFEEQGYREGLKRGREMASRGCLDHEPVSKPVIENALLHDGVVAKGTTVIKKDAAQKSTEDERNRGGTKFKTLDAPPLQNATPFHSTVHRQHNIYSRAGPKKDLSVTHKKEIEDELDTPISPYDPWDLAPYSARRSQ